MSATVDKKLSRRDLLKLMGATAATGMLAACVPAAAPAPAAPAEKPAEAEKPAAEPAKPAEKELIMWGLKYDPHITRYNALAKAFSEKTGTEVTVQPQDDPFGKPLVALAAGNPPDVACVMGKALAPYLVKKAVVDVTDLVYKAVGTDIEKDWYGDGIPCYTWEGKLYGVPTEFSTISLAGAWPTEDKKYNAITADEAKKYPPNTTTRLQAD
jgi:ABC-type glycerol-3-phosphate transport system substrate-binding protein